MRVTARATGSVAISEITPVATTARRGAASEEPVLPIEFQSDRVSVEKTYAISVDPAAPIRRGDELPVIEIDVEAAADEASLVVLRHPSGAITFHPGETTTVRGAVSKRVSHFRIPLRRANTVEGRRGLITQVIKAAVIKVSKPVADAAVSFVLPKLAKLLEDRIWRKRGLSEGWFRVLPPPGPGALQLEPATPQPASRNLLLLHGTFSDAASAYRGLTETDFFRQAASVYDDRIFAFNHFTISRSPLENAEALLDGLPGGRCQFDVVTHSRGGLVLRTIVERSADLGPRASRFQLGRAVLVASPNDGTPLATPDRWDKTIGWIANLLKIIDRFAPENPWITGAEFVAEGIVWLAHHISGDLPGLRSMDAAGETIENLQGPPAPPLQSYSALVANFHPDANIAQIIADAGADQFFGSANDLVVPSEGGWRVDRDGVRHIAAASVGCFGPGGNLAPAEPSAVVHTNFFHRKETANFITRALAGEDQQLAVIDVNAPLPDRRFLRAVAAAAPQADVVRRLGRPAGPLEAPGAFTSPTTAARDTFHIVIIEIPAEVPPQTAEKAAVPAVKSRRRALIYAAYGGARVVEEFALRDGSAGRNWQRIIALHQQIKAATDLQQGTMPNEKQMDELGKRLFRTLFPGDVKRLYDTARSLQGGRHLDLVFTSMIPWISEKPWEFAFDPGRATYLATEEIHFVRNVLTQIPGDAGDPRPGPLRILVVSAQPAGTVELSIDEETDLIRRDFSPLTDAGLVQIDVLPRATIAELHGHVATAKYNVVHFIGHGIFDRQANQGYLLFQGQPGAPAELLDERSARELFCGRGISLLFLNACQTSAASPADFNSGLAQSLVAHGLPALVANQYSVADLAATAFSQFFYWGLARGLSLGSAAREARIAVNYSLRGDAVIDWAVPVLYARDPNSSLSSGMPSVPFVMPAGAGPAAIRRRALSHSFRIAVWDVDRALPDLDDILEKMNNAQRRYGFQLANISAPLDSFRTEGGKRYLWKERVAKRLDGRARELAVDALLCLTHHPLSRDADETVFAWWPPKLKSSVLIFSYADMKLDPSSRATARALTNAIVRALAATQKRIPLHAGPPAQCPMYANKAADLKVITGEQRFGPECMKQFPDPESLADLETLLRLFDEPIEAAARKRRRVRRK